MKLHVQVFARTLPSPAVAESNWPQWRGPQRAGLRLGLCCQFARDSIKFRTTTATAILRLGKRERMARLTELWCLYVTAAARKRT